MDACVRSIFFPNKDEIKSFVKKKSGFFSKFYSLFLKSWLSFCLLRFPYPLLRSEYNRVHDQLVNFVDQWFTNIKNS